MKSRCGIPAAAVMVVILAAPLTLAANSTRADASMRKAIAGNLAEIKVGGKH